MNTKRTLSILGLFLLNFYACENPGDTKKTKSHLVSDHPVHGLFLSSIEAFNQRNLDLFVSNFSDDISMYGTDGNYEGKKALRTRFAELFQQFPNMKMEIPELEVEILSEQVVRVDFKWKLYPMGQGPSYRGIGSGIYIYQNDKWIEILEVERTTQVDPELIPQE